MTVASPAAALEDDHLPEIVRSGRAVLFLGAGASRGARDAKGDMIPLGNELKRKISDQFLGAAFDEADFKTVCDFAASRESVRDLQLFIHQRLYGFQPAPFHLLIPKFVWAGIATTNYDLIIERAYEQADVPLQELKPYCKDGDWTADNIVSNQLLYVKLHGCITRYQDVTPPPPLIASTEQIINHRDGRAGQFSQLLEWAKTKTILFVGYGLSDSNLRAMFEEIRKDGDNRHRHYIVRPDITAIERDYWADRRVRTVSLNFEQLLEELDGKIAAAGRKLALTPAAF